jgi:hypothetical protein
MSDAQVPSDHLLSDAELLAKIRRGEAGEEAAQWIEDLKRAWDCSHNQAMLNGMRARKLQMMLDERNEDTLCAISFIEAYEPEAWKSLLKGAFVLALILWWWLS